MSFLETSSRELEKTKRLRNENSSVAIFCMSQKLKERDFVRILFVIVLGLNDTSTLVGHFVSSPREREKTEDEREGQVRKRKINKSEEKKKQKIPLPLPVAKTAGLA